MKRKPKYKVGDLVWYKTCLGEEKCMKVTFIDVDEYGRYIYYNDGPNGISIFMYEENIIDVPSSIRAHQAEETEPNDEEYQLYLKLKKKYECVEN